MAEAEGSTGAGAEGASPGPPPSAEGSSAAIQRLETQVLPTVQAEATARDSAAKEAADPNNEPNVPAQVRANKDFKEAWGDLYAAGKANSPDGNVDTSQIDKLSLDLYYDNLAGKMQGEGIPQETKDSPLYKQALGSALEQAQKEGKPLDSAEIERRALSDYQRQKDLQGEVKGKDETEPKGEASEISKDLRDPNKLKAAINGMPWTDEQKAAVLQLLLKEKDKPRTALEWLLLIVSTVIQETAGMVIPRAR